MSFGKAHRDQVLMIAVSKLLAEFWLEMKSLFLA